MPDTTTPANPQTEDVASSSEPGQGGGEGSAAEQKPTGELSGLPGSQILGSEPVQEGSPTGEEPQMKPEAEPQKALDGDQPPVKSPEEDTGESSEEPPQDSRKYKEMWKWSTQTSQRNKELSVRIGELEKEGKKYSDWYRDALPWMNALREHPEVAERLQVQTPQVNPGEMEKQIYEKVSADLKRDQQKQVTTHEVEGWIKSNQESWSKYSERITEIAEKSGMPITAANLDLILSHVTKGDTEVSAKTEGAEAAIAKANAQIGGGGAPQTPGTQEGVSFAPIASHFYP